MMNDVMGAATVQLNGIEKSREFWTNSYVAVYVINREDLLLQTDRAPGKVSAKTEKAQALLNDVKARVKESVNKVRRIDFGRQ